MVLFLIVYFNIFMYTFIKVLILTNIAPLFCFSLDENTAANVLSEEDIPGSKLPFSNPKQCSIPQLKRWLACRGIPSKSKTKAELVVKVQGVIDSGVKHTFVDPTKEKVNYKDCRVMSGIY